MKKVKVIFPDGSIAEIEESELSGALAAGAKRHTEKSTSMVFKDGSIADILESDMEGAISAGAVKKKVTEDGSVSGSIGGSFGGTVGTSNPQLKSTENFTENFLDPAFEINKKKQDNSIITNSQVLGKVEIPDDAIPANIIDKKGYRTSLQQRLNSKTPEQIDLQVIATTTNKPVEAVEAYSQGRDGKGIMIEFDAIKETKASELNNLITKANTDLGLADTFEAVFTSPETASLYISKVQNAYQRKAAQDAEKFTTGNKAVFLPEGMIDKELMDVQAGMEGIKSAATQTVSKIKSIIGQDILSKIENDNSLTYEQKVKKAGDLVFGNELKNISEAEGKRFVKDSFGALNIVNQFGKLFRDEDEETKNLNSINAIVETKLNREIQKEIVYKQAAMADILQLAMEKNNSGTLTEEDKVTYQQMVTQLKDDIAAKQKDYKSPQVLQKEYPILLKQSVIADINNFNAIQSGNVKGYEESGYKGISLKEHLKAQGYDMNSQVVKDAISDAESGVGVKDYSFFGEPIKAIKEVFTSSVKSLGDIVGVRDDVTALSEKKAAELFPTTVGANDELQLTTAASTAQNIANTTGQVIGQGLMQAGTAGLGRLAGLSKVAAANAGFWSSGALTSYDAAYKDSFDFIDSNVGRTAYAGLIALSNAASEKIFPESKLFNIPGVKSAYSELASKIGTEGFTDKLATQLLTKAKNEFLDYGKKYATNIGKETLEETATSLFESGSRMLFGDPNMNVSKAIEDAKNTAIQTAIGTVLIGGMGVHKDVQQERNIAPSSVIYNAAVYKDEAMDALNIGFKQGNYDQQELNSKISLLNTAEVGLSELKKAEQVIGRELTRPQKELFVANSTAQKLLIEQKKGVEDEAVIAKIDEKLKNLNSQQKQLLDNKVQIDEFGNVIVPVKETPKATVAAEETTDEKIQRLEQELESITDDNNPRIAEIDAELTVLEQKDKKIEVTETPEAIINALQPTEKLSEIEISGMQSNPVAALQMIADQALGFGRVGDVRQPLSETAPEPQMEQTVSKYGQELVDKAIAMFPAEKIEATETVTEQTEVVPEIKPPTNKKERLAAFKNNYVAPKQPTPTEQKQWNGLSMQEKLALAKENLPEVDNLTNTEAVKVADQNAKMLLGKLNKTTEVVEEVPPVIEVSTPTVESKKWDIEKRRNKELTNANAAPEHNEPYTFPSGFVGTIDAPSKKAALAKINAKYDAELKALEKQPVESKEVGSNSVVDETKYNKENDIDETQPVFYHGTTVEKATSIKKDGFYKEHNVNITDDLSEAKEYADGNAEDNGSKPAIIKVRLKKGAKPKAEEGLDSMAYDAKDVVLDYSEIKSSPSSSKSKEVIPDQQSYKVNEEANNIDNVNIKENEPAIADDSRENELAVNKLAEQDNIEQEPNVKAIEQQAENVERIGSKEIEQSIDQANELVNAAIEVVNVPIAEISTKLGEYQGRKNKFSERSAKKVAEQFDKNKLQPIVVYKHPDGNTYVLSGHSRLEGMKRRNATTIPATYFEGTPEQAKEFAQTSNKQNDLQTDIENAAYYRKKLLAGESYNAVLKEAKENEQEGSAKRIISLAHLNPKGKTMDALEQLDKGEGDSKTNILNIATKIGDIRAKNDHLTNAHENELFEFMAADKKNIPTDKDLANVSNTLNRSINNAKFTPEEPLNLDRVVNKSANRIQWEKELREIEEQQTELKLAVNPSKKTGWTGLKDKAIRSLVKGENTKDAVDKAAAAFENNENGVKDAYQKQLETKRAELASVNDKLAKHLLREKDLIQGDKAQQSLFSIQSPTTQEISDMKDIVKDYVDEGTASLQDIQDDVAKELGDNSQEMRDLVEKAYNEFTKTTDFAPKEITGGVIGRVGKFLSRLFGGTAASKVFILKDTASLQEKAEQLSEVKFQNSNAIFETRDGKPIGFNYDTEQVARKRFNISKLNKIGVGSDRTVFDLGNGKVLKVAHSARGLEQNIYEGSRDLVEEWILPKVYERGLNYVVTDNVPKLKVTDSVDKFMDDGSGKIGTDTARVMFEDLKQFTQKDFDEKDSELQDVLRRYGLSYVMNYDLLWNDFTAARNWGLSEKGKPVHIDGGTFGGVDSVINSYRGKKNLDDAEFRDIYNKSKQLKKQYGDTDKFTKFMKSPNGDILGFATPDGKVYLNAEHINPNSPIHEAGHIWTEWAKTNQPEVYAIGMQLTENSKYLKEVKANEFYKAEASKLGSESSKEYNDYMKHEALAMAIGDKGAQFVGETRKKDFKEWLNNLWNKIKAAAGFKDITASELQNLTFDEFTKRAAADILRDEEITQPQGQQQQQGTGTTPAAAPQPKIKTKLTDVEVGVIREVLDKPIDAKEFPTFFDMNAQGKQQTAVTQEAGQDRVALDGTYVKAHLEDLRSISLNNARILQDALGKDWKEKLVGFLEDNPTAGNIAQVSGLLNVINTDIYNEIAKSKSGTEISKLKDLQARADRITYDTARSASLALNQRRMYQDFGQGKDVADILSAVILTPEQQAMKSKVEEALKQKFTDEELNKPKPVKPKKAAQPKSTKTAKPKSDDSVKKDLISKGKKAAQQTDADGNVTIVSLKDKIQQANDALNGFKC